MKTDTIKGFLVHAIKMCVAECRYNSTHS